MEGQPVFSTDNPKYTYGLNRFIAGSLNCNLSVGGRNKISDLVQSEWAYQRQAKQVKKPSPTVSRPIGRFLVHVDKNQQSGQLSSEKKSGLIDFNSVVMFIGITPVVSHLVNN